MTDDEILTTSPQRFRTLNKTVPVIIYVDHFGSYGDDSFARRRDDAGTQRLRFVVGIQSSHRRPITTHRHSIGQ